MAYFQDLIVSLFIYGSYGCDICIPVFPDGRVFFIKRAFKFFLMDMQFDLQFQKNSGCIKFGPGDLYHIKLSFFSLLIISPRPKFGGSDAKSHFLYYLILEKTVSFSVQNTLEKSHKTSAFLLSFPDIVLS